MKKSNGIIILIVVVIANGLCPIEGRAESKFRLDISGGCTYFASGDVNPGTQAFLEWGKSGFATSEGAYKSLHLGYEAGGDLIYALSGRLGLGLSAGFVRCSIRNQANGWDGDYGPSALFTTESELTAVPIRLFVEYAIPLKGKFGLIADAGLTYYLSAKYYSNWQETYSVATSVEYWLDITTDTTKPKVPLGFQGGLGVEYHLSRRLALSVEAQGRWARFRGLRGTSVANIREGGNPIEPLFEEEGVLYYGPVASLAGSPRLIMVQSAPPSGSAREAIVDFSGVSLRAGIRVYF